ncbi:hypothetical protein IWQ62_001068 [Dispira parvispora]|uniref:Protein PBN1 n=1 Tax=Dispira parvispora TaxID=1520584 RepID=A0A9W8ATA2_9FUNG|nr:hypothetical protein IWQ62_001068 [Dispira parvispora]
MATLRQRAYFRNQPQPSQDKKSLYTQGEDNYVTLGLGEDALRLDHEQGMVTVPSSLEKPGGRTWPRFLRHLDITIVPKRSSWLPCTPISAQKERCVLDNRSPWLARWLLPAGVHLRITLHNGHIQPSPETLQELSQWLIGHPEGLFEFSKDSGGQIDPLTYALHLLKNPETWVDIGNSEFYIYLDNQPVSNVVRQWLDRRTDFNHSAIRPLFPWYASLLSVLDDTEGTAPKLLSVSLDQAENSQVRWESWVWSMFLEHEARVLPCESTRPATADCTELFVLTVNRSPDNDVLTYQGMELSRSDSSLIAKPFTTQETLPPIGKCHFGILPLNSMHPNLVLEFPPTLAPDDKDTWYRNFSRLDVVQWLPTGIFADPYQLVDYESDIGHSTYTGPIELELPLDRISNVGTILSVELPLPNQLWGEGHRSQVPSKTRKVSIPLHARYKLVADDFAYAKISVPAPWILATLAKGSVQLPEFPARMRGALQPPTPALWPRHITNSTLVSVVKPGINLDTLNACLADSGDEQTVKHGALVGSQWFGIPPNDPNTDYFTLRIPTGQISHTQSVLVVTQTIVLISFLWVLSHAWRRSYYV